MAAVIRNIIKHDFKIGAHMFVYNTVSLHYKYVICYTQYNVCSSGLLVIKIQLSTSLLRDNMILVFIKVTALYIAFTGRH